MWECPDFFPVARRGRNGLDTSAAGPALKHVMKVSLDLTRFEYYTLGSYSPEKIDLLRSGGATEDPVGWSNESDSVADDVAKNWAGIQTIPRAVWLDNGGRQLVQWPVQELEKLRGRRWKDAQELCKKKGADVAGGVGPFGLWVLASGDLSERTAVFFRVFKGKEKHVVLLCHDDSSSTSRAGVWKPSFAGFVDVDIQKDRKISLRSLIDASVVESFGAGGKTCITSRVYPVHAVGGAAHLHAFNNGAAAVKISLLRAWQMGTPNMNQPTEP
ncbi:unnamed protein product [Spirodela intermedia]|uniref:Uncharacterized protein n=1 Tax=Spirodela intermedia TaxID=51605 RepID=A0A7I8J0J0_SPIIN|nr:unnamed protein product [Spirodela intermedia]CAA6663754.1 unnamed protein product [Spirodela intermedia]